MLEPIKATVTRLMHRVKFSTKSYSTIDSATLDMKAIPSPKQLPLIGSTVSLMMAGSMPRLHWYIDKRHKELGPIFRDNVGPVDCIFLCDPDGMRTVFAHEGKYPLHIIPEAWKIYNKLHNISRGLLFMDGEEWLHHRRIMNNLLLKDYLWLEECCRPVVDDLVETIRTSCGTEVFPNLEETLYRWSLGVIVSVLVGPDKYSEIKDQLRDRIEQVATTVHLVFEASSKLALVNAGFAAKWRIGRWRKFESTVTKTMFSVKELLNTLDKYDTNDKKGLLSKMRDHVTMDVLSKIVTDLILAAGDTTAYSMEWLLYSLSKNGTIQQRLREELFKNEGKNARETSISLLKNAVKEGLRLYPVAPFLTRILPESCAVMGYNIPAGTLMVLSIFTTGRDARYFENPDKFDLDRWTNREGRSSIVQSANLPFAIGARSCIGKKLAEIQLQMTLAAILRNFEFTVLNEREVDPVLKMVLVPSKPIQLNFKPLN